jgi:hypothetical protein
MVADELDRPRRVALMKLTEMEGGDGEDRERRRPQRAAKPGLPSCHRSQRDDERQKRVGEQPHPEFRWDRPAGDCEQQVERRGDPAREIRGHADRTLDAAANPLAFSPQHRMHDDGRQKPQRAEAEGREKWKRTFDADSG